jgi:hypothetical protein
MGKAFGRPAQKRRGLMINKTDAFGHLSLA